MKKFKIEPRELTEQDILKIVNPGGNTDMNYQIQNRINKAKEEEPMKQLFGNYFHSGEICLLAGDTAAGKTLLAYQSGDLLSRGLDILEQTNEVGNLIILYYDFELSNQSLLKRYPNYQFSGNFLCPDISEILLSNQGIFSIQVIKSDIERTGANVVVIDNISAISLKSTQDADTALQLMKDFKLLSIEKGVSFLILCHIPKIPGNIPLTINHIAGSKLITNFADNCIIIGKSSQGIERRYLKQLKSRNAELIEKVMVMDIVFDDYIKFQFVCYDDEKNHLNLDETKELDKKNKLIEIAKTIFGSASLTYNEFCNLYSKHYHKTIDRGKQIHNQLKMNNLIIKDEETKKWLINGNEIPF
jgi:hypothetical protein